MSNVAEMPEILNFQGLMDLSQATYNDKTMSAAEAIDLALADCAKKAMRYGKKATVDLALELTRGNMDEILINVKLKTKEPDPLPVTYVAYTDRQGRLCIEDPTQTKLPLEMKKVASNDRD